MKLRSYQLCRWCDALWHARHRWFKLGLLLLALVLSVLLGLGWLSLPLAALTISVMVLYYAHLRHAFGASYQRTPRPKDALCETVLIDAELIGQGTRLRAAAQPIDVAESLSMRLGSGAVLLGAAITLTADELDPADRSALLSAVHGLNIKPDRMRTQYPVMARELEGTVHRITVKDGISQRRYYCGTPAEVADLCDSIWEGHTRPMEDYDHLRIADAASYIAQGECRVLAYATALDSEPPVFLGLCGLGEEIDLVAVQDVAALRTMGLTVMLAPGATGTDLDSLRALMELPQYHAKADLRLTTHAQAGETPLCITCKPGNSLQEPVHNLRARFRLTEDILRRFALYAGLPVLLGLLLSCWTASLTGCAMLLYAALLIGTDANALPPSKPRLMLLGFLALVSKAILLTQAAPLASLAGGIITVTAALACALRLCGSRYQWRGHCLVLPAAAGLFLLISILTCLSHGLSLLLPLGFASLVSAVLWLGLK